MKTHFLTLFLTSTMLASSATFTQTRQITLEIDGNDPELYGESADTSVPKFPPLGGQLTSVEFTLSGDWSNSYHFQNSANGTAGNVRYTPHPYLWMQTRLPDSWSFHAESIGTARETDFIAGSAGTTTDSASGTATMSAVAPATQLSKFIGTGTSTLDLEIRDDSLLENLSSTPTEGTFLRSMLVNVTLTVTYQYEPIPSSHKIIHVKKGAAGNGSGDDWDNAFPDLQPAIAAAQPGDEIWVAEGTYHPVASGGDRNISFEMQGGVSWYGGFAGNETARDQRNPVAHSTILSGDMNGDDGGGTGVNARWYHMSENSYQIVRAGNLITPAAIDGFTITRGSFSNTFSGSGMGISYCADILVENCKIIGNLSGNAAGILNTASHTRILGCHFEDNYASGGRGGAIYHSGDNSNFATSYALTVQDTTFLANRSASSIGSASGGAIYCQSRAPVEINRCLFENNRADWRFSYGSYNSYGGAMLIFSLNSRIINSTFRGNSAHIGGALWIARDTRVVNCLFVKNEAFRQSQGFYDYGGYAGAIYAPGGFSTTGTALIDHCTFHANTARSVGGILGNPSLTVSNSILYTNTSTEVEATLLDQQLSGSPNLHHSCVKGLLAPGNGNINSDPLFFDQDGADGIPGNADDELRLNNGSLCIDSGDDSAFPADLDALDIAGLPRFQDDPFSAGTASDMGAYEFVPGSGTNPDNLLPTSSFTHVIGTANEVTFTDTSTDSDGTITHWVWNFGDGNSSATQNPVHTYAANGSYTVTLVVIDNLNGTAISSPTNLTVSGLTTGSLSISSPAPNSTVAGAIDIEANGTPDIVRVKLYVDDVYTEQKDSSPPFSITWDSTSVPDGTHTIQYKGNDEADDEAFWSAPITVNVVNTMPPTPIEAWQADHFTAAELANPGLEATLWGDSADPDGDAISNMVEFALGTDPLVAGLSSDAMTVTLEDSPDGSHLVMTFLRRMDDPDPVSYTHLTLPTIYSV